MGNISYWGITPKTIKHFFKDRVKQSVDGTVVTCGYVSLRYFVSDCGAVTISNLGNAEPGNINDAIEYCRLSGYSLLIGTATAKEVADMMKEHGFTVTKVGQSHRNSSKPHYLVHYRIPEDKFDVKGYTKTEIA